MKDKESIIQKVNMFILFSCLGVILVALWVKAGIRMGQADLLAFIGSILSGIITLYGVMVTIKSSFEGIRLTLEKQEEAFEKQLKIAATEKRLINLYEPLYQTLDDYNYAYGAHEYEDLTDEEKEKILRIISDNVIYANGELYEKYMELRWAIRFGKDSEKTNKFYHDISNIVNYELDVLRKELRLPTRKKY
ncbi:hypothetical protein FZC66_10045 [Priestia megaterium]|nr:hypothetical protein FZC66_10045 [Priestia megaterium]